MNVEKSVIPATGFGTRFLPVTKAQPKKMKLVVDKPTIQYVVEEAVDAGLNDILLIAGRGNQSIEGHFDKSYELEELKSAGEEDRLDCVRDVADLADIYYVSKNERSGLGDAVKDARKHVGDEPFAILHGDTIVESDTPCTANLIQYAEGHDESIIPLERVPWKNLPAYGVTDVGADASTTEKFPIADRVEKPAHEDAPSTLAITGRYVLTPDIFAVLERIAPGVGDELQLMPALRKLKAVRGEDMKGDRYDIGNIPDWLRANIQMALNHDDGDMNEAVEHPIREQLSE